MSIKKFFITVLVQMILLFIVVFFAFWNYRLFSFDKGFSKTYYEGNDIISLARMALGTQKIEYYENPFPKDEQFKYCIHIETYDDSYLLLITQEGIDALRLSGLFYEGWAPTRVTPIPFYVEIIVAILILLLPYFYPKKKRSTDEE